MARKTLRLISMTVLVALVLTLSFTAFAANTDAAFTIYTIDGYSTPIGGATFSLVGADGSSVASTTTGASGYATMTIPSATIADEGSTNFSLVQTGVPSNYEATDNNWAVTVSIVDNNPVVDITTDGLWDTIFDWIDGSVITGSEYSSGTLTVANIARYFEIPECTKTVVGLSYTQMQGYTSDYELTDASGRVVANGHAIGFAVQEDESFKAPIAFDALKLPSGTYTLKELSVTEIEDMDFEGSKLLNNGAVVVDATGSGETVYAEYAVPVIYTPPVETTTPPNTTPTNTTTPHTTAPIATAPITETTDDDSPDNDSDKPDTSDENEQGESYGDELNEVIIDDDEVPTAATPERGGIITWIVIAVAGVIVIISAIFFAKKSKYKE